MVGGYYTYAEVPFFEDLFGMTRNNYDKPSHLAQGFVPANIALLTLSRLHDRQIENQSWRGDDNDGLPMDRRTFS